MENRVKKIKIQAWENGVVMRFISHFVLLF